MKTNSIKIVLVISIILDTTFAGMINSSMQIINVNENDSVTKINKVELIPNRPIGKTIIGYVLAIEGVLAIPFGIILMAKTQKYESHEHSIGGVINEGYFLINRWIGLTATVEGIGCVIPGAILLYKSNKEWKLYNEYQNKQLGNDSEIKLNFAFEF
jgi:hypothetical protein